MAALATQTLNFCNNSSTLCAKPTPLKAAVFRTGVKKLEVCGGGASRSSFAAPIKAMEASEATKHANGAANQSVSDSAADDCSGCSGIHTHTQSSHMSSLFLPFLNSSRVLVVRVC